MEISNNDIVQEALFKWEKYVTAFSSIHENTETLLLNTIQSKYYFCTYFFLVRLLWCGKGYLQNIVSFEEKGSKHFFKRPF